MYQRLALLLLFKENILFSTKLTARLAHCSIITRCNAVFATPTLLPSSSYVYVNYGGEEW